jgi:parallel beta helix pectate lyase-like protein
MFRHLFDRLGWGIAGAATLTLVLVLAGVVSAGPLDPTGPPSSPSGVFGAGTPISSLPVTITTPGSYYITGNLTGTTTHGITIASHDVSLDLRGFTLIGVPGSGDGVKVASGTTWRGLTVRNGTVRGWSGSGFYLQTVIGGLFDSLTAESNGQFGIVVGGSGATLSHCAATNNLASGISANGAIVRDCVAASNQDHGFQITTAVLTNCIAAYNQDNGMDAGNSRIEGCRSEYNTLIGINARGSEVIGNTVLYNSGTGVEVSDAGSFVARNNVHGNSQVGVGYGINVTGTVSRIEDNHVTDFNAVSQDVGIRVVGGENVVIRNSAHDNAVNYDLSGAGGTYGPLATAVAATNPFTNIDY